jgi:hypothetical protein
MTRLFSTRQIFGAVVIAAALTWAGGMVASSLPQTTRLPANLQSPRVVDYATDVAVPGSRFSTRPTYDQ